MTAIPEPSEVVMRARIATRRDSVLASDISSLSPSQVRSALYWLASDPDGIVHVAVAAAVAGQVAAAIPAGPPPASDGVTVWACACGATVANVRPEDGLCGTCRLAAFTEQAGLYGEGPEAAA